MNLFLSLQPISVFQQETKRGYTVADFGNVALALIKEFLYVSTYQ